MSGFQRFVSYINIYEENNKIRNVGFAKIEKQGEQCKIEIHLKGTGYTGIACPVYVFVRREEKMEGILIGKIQLSGGSGTGSFRLEETVLLDNGYEMSQIGGFLIFVTERVMFVSQWDDGGIVREQFVILEEKKQVQETAETEKNGIPEKRKILVREDAESRRMPEKEDAESRRIKGKKVSGNQKISEKEVQGSRKLSEKAVQENRKISEEEANESRRVTEKESQGNRKISEEAFQESDRTIEAAEDKELKATEAVPQPKETPEPPWEQKWQFILENYPVMTPFEGETEILCVRMELKDLRLLPKRYWYLGNNSFLLHGFFNYRYLILGAMEQDGQKQWFLGVPGVFQSQEKVMAAIFGFPEYRSEKIAQQKTGQFGYWYRFL